MKNLVPHKARGSDGISPFVLGKYEENLEEPLLKVFQICFTKGVSKNGRKPV